MHRAADAGLRRDGVGERVQRGQGSGGRRYKAAKARCDGLSGNPKDVCIAEAKAAEKKAKADAEAAYKNTDAARRNARIAAAEADYDVAHAKCGAKTGNDKDVCNKEAKAAETKTIADAKATQKIAAAKADAKEDKMDADYKVAIEKCDALSGAAKDSCVTPRRPNTANRFAPRHSGTTSPGPWILPLPGPSLGGCLHPPTFLRPAAVEMTEQIARTRLQRIRRPRQRRAETSSFGPAGKTRRAKDHARPQNDRATDFSCSPGP